MKRKKGKYGKWALLIVLIIIAVDLLIVSIKNSMYVDVDLLQPCHCEGQYITMEYKKVKVKELTDLKLGRYWLCKDGQWHFVLVAKSKNMTEVDKE